MRVGTILACCLFVVSGLSLACASPRVETRIRSDADLSSHETLIVLPVVMHEADPSSASAAGSSELIAELERQTRSLLEEKGYRLAEAGSESGSADLLIQIQLSTERVTRRVWSSDPDANGYVTREIEEARLVLRALGPDATTELWRGEARSRLPQRAPLVGADAEQIWMNALAEVIDRFPQKRPDS